RPFTTYSVRVEDDQPVQPDLAGPAFTVPATAADIDPAPAEACLVFRVTGVVLAGQHEGEKLAALLADHQHRPVLALARVFLERHPAPHNLAGVRMPITHIRFVRDRAVAPGVLGHCDTLAATSSAERPHSRRAFRGSGAHGATPRRAPGTHSSAG